MATINSDGFLISSNVNVYPCAYRNTSVDLKSKVNLEENIVRTALRGTGSYLIQTGDTIRCFIKGYYFEFQLGGETSYIGVTVNIATTTDGYETKVLAPYGGSAGDSVDAADSTGTLYFKAVKFLKSGVCDLYFDETKNVKPISHSSIGSSHDTTAITGNLIDGSATGSIRQIDKDDGTGTSATGVNSAAFGEGTAATQRNEIAIGAYNAAGAEGTVFTVGTGKSASDRHTLISISDRENVRIGKKGTVAVSKATITVPDSMISGTVNFGDAHVVFSGNVVTVANTCEFRSYAPIRIENATASTSSTTGALTVIGGVGISGALNVAGTAIFASQATFQTQVRAPSYYATSDERKKTNIVDYSPEKSILDLPIKEFDLKADGTHHIGCIAQDLQKICPEIVKEDHEGYLSIEESKIAYLLLDEIKKLRKEIDEIKSELR